MAPGSKGLPEEFIMKGLILIFLLAASEVYRFIEAEDNLQVRYPDAEHDFPPAVRLQAYRFIDKVLEHTPNHHEIK